MAKAMILPYLDYGIAFLSLCDNKSIQRLQVLQNRILKCALGLHRSFGTFELHKLARVLTIKDRIIYNQLIHHDILTNSSLFPVKQQSYAGTRSSVSLQLTVIKNKHGAFP